MNSRLVRTQKALDHAVGYADDDDTTKAANSLNNARPQVKLAWRAAKSVIQHAPPPPGGDGLAARMSGGTPPGGTIADRYQTTGAVLDLQHSVAQTAIGMIDTAHGTLRDSLSRTMFLALDQRDAAIAYIHSIDTPPPTGGDGIAAHKSGGAVARLMGHHHARGRHRRRRRNRAARRLTSRPRSGTACAACSTTPSCRPSRPSARSTPTGRPSSATAMTNRGPRDPRGPRLPTGSASGMWDVAARAGLVCLSQ